MLPVQVSQQMKSVSASQSSTGYLQRWTLYRYLDMLYCVNLRAASAVATVVSIIAVIIAVVAAHLLVLVFVDDFSLGSEWMSDGSCLRRLNLGLDLLDDAPEEAADWGAGLDTGGGNDQDQH